MGVYQVNLPNRYCVKQKDKDFLTFLEENKKETENFKNKIINRFPEIQVIYSNICSIIIKATEQSAKQISCFFKCSCINLEDDYN